jgi:hypothetical protein
MTIRARCMLFVPLAVVGGWLAHSAYVGGMDRLDAVSLGALKPLTASTGTTTTIDTNVRVVGYAWYTTQPFARCRLRVQP